MTSFLSIYWNPDPEFISWGFLHVRYYGLLFTLAFIASYIVMLHIFKLEKIPRPLLEKLTVNIIVATFIGARLGHCLFYDFDHFLSQPLEIILPIKLTPKFQFIGYQGLASHGAAIGILIGIWYWCRKHKKNYLWLLDRIGIVAALAGMLIRLGNLMNSEIYGGPTTLPWGFQFVHSHDWQEIGLPCHPTQIYEALSCLVIFCLLFFLYKKNGAKLYRGFLFGLFLILLFVSRFFIEFIKNTQVDFEDHLFLKMGQLLSLPFIIFGIFLVWRSFRKKENFYLSSTSSFRQAQ